ncbi:BrnT family toxin [Bdellovibrio sp. SKB1291214]|uniref:BrnT family toxin n=1 Tax=Bdellovibrio sp. SKB1291214 TaxID=1732569 RepID=UPI000B5189F0|nr:BrnT family toxin [Bdellovibrio sp. SKB1291214]UYL09708.1 BrnT family toxin [Bdellovibrio sp. SKB1291214]
MELIEFEWDDHKASMNRQKHGISFAEAVTIWKDDSALEIADPDHSDDEDRWIRLGMTDQFKTLVVVFVEKSPGIRVRVISARKATSKENEQYFARRL